MPNQHFLLTNLKANARTNQIGQKLANDQENCLKVAFMVAGREPTLSSEGMIGHRPDDDFHRKPNKKSADSTKDSPFA